MGRGLLNRVLPWVNKKLAWPGGVLSISLALCFLGAAFTEYIGIHAIFGAFIMGVAFGDSEHFSERAKEIVHQFINNIFAPLFFCLHRFTCKFLHQFRLVAYFDHYCHCLCRKKLSVVAWAPDSEVYLARILSCSLWHECTRSHGNYSRHRCSRKRIDQRTSFCRPLS